MLVITGDNLNAYKALKDVLYSDKAHAVIDDRTIKVRGELSDNTLKGFLEQDISGMSNVEEKEEKGEEKKLIFYRGGVSYQSERKRKKTKREDLFRPESWEFWRADFGIPVGRGEMGYIHYVLVYCEGDNPDSYIVFPCTSKYREYDSIYRIKFSEENMTVYDEQFLENSKETYILFNKQEPLDISRFEKKVGVVDEKYVSEILKSLKYSQEVLEKKAIKNLDQTQIKAGKRNLTKENIKLTAKQSKIMEHVCETDVFSVANNMNYTYERRLYALMNAFGLPVTGDGEFLIDFIKRVKVDGARVDTVFNAMSRRKNKPAKVIREKLCVIMRKRFKMDESCLTEFANLVNVLAG